jgi:hypothetical protein
MLSGDLIPISANKYLQNQRTIKLFGSAVTGKLLRNRLNQTGEAKRFKVKVFLV